MSKEPYWGYSTDGDFYTQLDAGTKEDALVEADNEYPDGCYTVAHCVPYKITPPDLDEAVIEWMCCGNSLKGIITDSAAGCNEDADYEGELIAEIYNSDTSEIEKTVRSVLDAALIRAGRADLVGHDFENNPVSDTDPVLDVLEKDAAFKADLETASQKWFDDNAFGDKCSTPLYISDEVEVPSKSTTPSNEVA